MNTPPDKIAAVAQPTDELAAWMAQYGAALHQFFSRKVGAAHADDLVQEVFLHLQVRVGRARADNVERYLFTVAKNVLIDRFRSDFSRRSSLHQPLQDSVAGSDDISPERILAAKQEYARALVAIADLPPRMQTAFMLHRFGKLSFAAVAKRMGITRSSVQVLIKRALDHIMADLEDGQ